MQMIAILFFLLLAQYTQVYAKLETIPSFVSRQSKTINPDLSQLRSNVKENGLQASSFHVEEVMAAIAAGKREVKVETHNHELKNRDTSDFAKFVDQVYQDTVTRYTLHGEDTVSSFVSLDVAHHAKAVKGIDETSITHCHELSEGDVIIASAHGRTVHSQSLEQGPLAYMQQSPRVTRNNPSGWLLVRRVLEASSPSSPSSTSGTKECTRYLTEDIHPLELFSDMSIESSFESPFRITHHPIPEGEKLTKTPTEFAKQRQLTVLDAGLISCTDSNYWNSWLGKSVSGPNWNVDVGLGYVCAEFLYTVPGSVAVNYDFFTSKAIQADMSLGNGVICHNCFAFVGAMFLLNIQYSSGHGFGMEIMLSGGAGYAVDLTINNPTITASITRTLVQATATYSNFNLGGGLSIGVKSNGFTGTLSGSGGATGYATLQSGLGFQAYAEILSPYSSSVQLKYGASNWGSLTHPYTLDYTKFGVTVLAARVDLSFSVGLQVTLVGVLTSQFEVTISPYASFSVGFQWAYLTIKIPGFVQPSRALSGDGVEAGQSLKAASAATSTVNKRLGGSSSQSKPTPTNRPRNFVPGDKVPIQIEYREFLPNDDIKGFFFMTNTKTKETHPIFNQMFRTSDTGIGEFTTSYELPWNAIFENLDDKAATPVEWIIECHMSNAIDKRVQTLERISISAFTDADSIFTAGAPADKSTINVESKLTLSWNPNSLRYFEPEVMSIGSGNERLAKDARIWLVGEWNEPTSPAPATTTTTATPSTPANSKTPIKTKKSIRRGWTTTVNRILLATTSNSKGASGVSVVIPKNATLFGDKFYLEVEGDNNLDSRGWSAGRFFLANPASSMKSAATPSTATGSATTVTTTTGNKKVSAAGVNRKRTLSTTQTSNSYVDRMHAAAETAAAARRTPSMVTTQALALPPIFRNSTSGCPGINESILAQFGATGSGKFLGASVLGINFGTQYSLGPFTVIPSTFLCFPLPSWLMKYPTQRPTQTPAPSPQPAPTSPAPTSKVVTCAPFTANRTSDASKNVAVCSFTACGGSTFTASVCPNFGGNYSGDTFLRLTDLEGILLSFNDDSAPLPIPCTLGSTITFTVPAFRACGTKYYLQQGCKGDDACSGTTVIVGSSTALTTGSPVTTPTMAPTISQAPTMGSTFRFNCPTFSVSNTNGGTTNYAVCGVVGCGSGQSFKATAQATNGSPLLSLYDNNGNNLQGPASSISYSIPTIPNSINGACATLTLRIGCVGSDSCAGSVQVTGTPSINYLAMTAPTQVPTSSPMMTDGIQCFIGVGTSPNINTQSVLPQYFPSTKYSFTTHSCIAYCVGNTITYDIATLANVDTMKNSPTMYPNLISCAGSNCNYPGVISCSPGPTPAPNPLILGGISCFSGSTATSISEEVFQSTRAVEYNFKNYMCAEFCFDGVVIYTAFSTDTLPFLLSFPNKFGQVYTCNARDCNIGHANCPPPGPLMPVMAPTPSVPSSLPAPSSELQIKACYIGTSKSSVVAKQYLAMPGCVCVSYCIGEVVFYDMVTGSDFATLKSVAGSTVTSLFANQTSLSNLPGSTSCYVAPTYEPTAVPTVYSNPTPRPTAVPSFRPTPRPTNPIGSAPISVTAAFKVMQQITGVDPVAFMASTLAKKDFVTAVFKQLDSLGFGISPEMITIVSAVASAASNRLSNSESGSSPRHLQSSGGGDATTINIAYNISFPSTHSTYQMQQTAIQSTLLYSVAQNKFQNDLKALASSSGTAAPLLLNANVTGTPLFSPPVILSTSTYSPNAMPTSLIVIDIESDMFKVSVALAVVSILFVCSLLAHAYIWYTRRKTVQRNMVAEWQSSVSPSPSSNQEILQQGGQGIAMTNVVHTGDHEQATNQAQEYNQDFANKSVSFKVSDNPLVQSRNL